MKKRLFFTLFIFTFALLLCACGDGVNRGKLQAEELRNEFIESLDIEALFAAVENKGFEIEGKQTSTSKYSGEIFGTTLSGNDFLEYKGKTTVLQAANGYIVKMDMNNTSNSTGKVGGEKITIKSKLSGQLYAFDNYLYTDIVMDIQQNNQTAEIEAKKTYFDLSESYMGQSIMDLFVNLDTLIDGKMFGGTIDVPYLKRMFSNLVQYGTYDYYLSGDLDLISVKLNREEIISHFGVDLIDPTNQLGLNVDELFANTKRLELIIDFVLKENKLIGFDLYVKIDSSFKFSGIKFDITANNAMKLKFIDDTEPFPNFDSYELKSFGDVFGDM